MNEDNDFREENLRRLIAAGFGHDARPDVSVRERTQARLIAALRARSRQEPRGFPEPVLLALAGAVVLCASLGLAGMLNLVRTVVPVGPLSLVMAVFCANLAAVPVGSVALVIRRKRNA